MNGMLAVPTWREVGWGNRGNVQWKKLKNSTAIDTITSSLIYKQQQQKLVKYALKTALSLTQSLHLSFIKIMSSERSWRTALLVTLLIYMKIMSSERSWGTALLVTLLIYIKITSSERSWRTALLVTLRIFYKESSERSWRTAPLLLISCKDNILCKEFPNSTVIDTAHLASRYVQWKKLKNSTVICLL